MEKSNGIDIRPASISLMRDIVNTIFLAQRNDVVLSYEKLALILQKGIQSIKNGLFMLRKLNILQDLSLNIKKKLYEKLDNQLLIEELIFNKIIIFPLFSEYIYLLGSKKQDIEATLFLKHEYSLGLSAKAIKSTMNGWIKFYRINLKIKAESYFLEDQEKSLENKVSAGILVRDLYGDTIEKIPEKVFLDLVEGINTADSKPKNSLTDTGRALEDFLRIKFDPIISLDRCNGIGQISNKLISKNLITPKHHSILKALSSIRAIGNAHGIDKKEMKSWHISKQSALIFSAQVIKTIRSLNCYVEGFLSF
ncbi:MAG: hypothetical protein ACFFG0_09110 [Candidatus Thorarchaeota archaeon]